MAEPIIEQPETKMCDQPECKNTAEFAYAWDWGQKGICCSEHAQLFQQRAPQLNRTVSIHPLPNTPAAAPPMQRDERVKLQAEVLVLQEEVKEANVRGLDLFRENTKLAQQVQLLTVRERELRHQLQDGESKVFELQNKLDARDVEHGEMLAELERLRTLERLVPASTRTVVEGSPATG